VREDALIDSLKFQVRRGSVQSEAGLSGQDMIRSVVAGLVRQHRNTDAGCEGKDCADHG
jgi:hypothetical protein